MAKETPVERVQIHAIGMAIRTVMPAPSAMPASSGSFQWMRIRPAE